VPFPLVLVLSPVTSACGKGGLAATPAGAAVLSLRLVRVSAVSALLFRKQPCYGVLPQYSVRRLDLPTWLLALDQVLAHALRNSNPRSAGGGCPPPPPPLWMRVRSRPTADGWANGIPSRPPAKSQQISPKLAPRLASLARCSPLPPPPPPSPTPAPRSRPMEPQQTTRAGEAQEKETLGHDQ
jgi:hypothetical protein